MNKNWCANFEILLNKAEEHDTREKIINSIKTLASECSESFANKRNMITSLKKLKKEYVKLNDSEAEDDAYFSELIHSIENVLGKIDTIGCIL